MANPRIRLTIRARPPTSVASVPVMSRIHPHSRRRTLVRKRPPVRNSIVKGSLTATLTLLVLILLVRRPLFLLLRILTRLHLPNRTMPRCMSKRDERRRTVRSRMMSSAPLHLHTRLGSNRAYPFVKVAVLLRQPQLMLSAWASTRSLILSPTLSEKSVPRRTVLWFKRLIVDLYENRG